MFSLQERLHLIRFEDLLFLSKYLCGRLLDSFYLRFLLLHLKLELFNEFEILLDLHNQCVHQYVSNPECLCGILLGFLVHQHIMHDPQLVQITQLGELSLGIFPRWEFLILKRRIQVLLEPLPFIRIVSIQFRSVLSRLIIQSYYLEMVISILQLGLFSYGLPYSGSHHRIFSHFCL